MCSHMPLNIIFKSSFFKIQDNALDWNEPWHWVFSRTSGHYNVHIVKCLIVKNIIYSHHGRFINLNSYTGIHVKLIISV